MLGHLSVTRLQTLSPALIERTLRRLREARLEDAARDLAPARPPDGIRARVWREIQAVLVSDSSLRLNYQLRAPDVAPRILVYETPEYAVALSISAIPETGAYRLRGQVTPRLEEPLPPVRQASVLHAGQERKADVSEFGEFVLTDLPGSWDQLDLTLGDVRVRFPLPPA